MNLLYFVKQKGEHILKYRELKGSPMERKIKEGPANGPYTVKEVCYRLQVSEATLKRRIREGKLKAYKNSGKLMITKTELDRFTEEFPKYKAKKKKSLSADDISMARDLDILNKLVKNTVSNTNLDEQQLYDNFDLLDTLIIKSRNIEAIKDLENQRELCLKLLRIYQQQVEVLSIRISQFNEIHESSAAELKLRQVIFNEELDESELDYMDLCNECLIKRFLIQEKIRLLNFILHGYHLREDDENASFDRTK